MHFLDPKEWNNLDELSTRFEELDEEKIKELHEMLRPYFLRRVKGEVLKLPPKVRVLSKERNIHLKRNVYLAE